MNYQYNQYEKPLVDWLTNNHPDVLKDIQSMQPNYPENWDLVDIMDDHYSDIYHYYSEHT